MSNTKQSKKKERKERDHVTYRIQISKWPNHICNYINCKRVNTPVKGQRLSDWKNKIQLYTVYKRHMLESKT